MFCTVPARKRKKVSSEYPEANRSKSNLRLWRAREVSGVGLTVVSGPREVGECESAVALPLDMISAEQESFCAYLFIIEWMVRRAKRVSGS